MPLHSHDAFTRRPTPLPCWTSVHFQGIFLRAKNRLPFAPWEPKRVPVPSCSHGPLLWSDPDAAGVCKGTTEECGGFTTALIDRGQDEDGSHVSWLWAPSLSLTLSFLCSHYTPSILFAVRLSPAACVLCALLGWCGARRGADNVTLQSLALCLTSAAHLMNSFTVRG